MQPLGLPHWPATPEPVDVSGRSWLVIACGAPAYPVAGEVAQEWAEAASSLGPTRRLDLAADPTAELDGALASALTRARTGVRIMVVGDRYAVLTVLAAARARGARAGELRSFVIAGPALPIFCAHCRDTHRVHAEPEGDVECPGCGRHLEVHRHHSAHRGSFLASDARAREIA